MSQTSHSLSRSIVSALQPFVQEGAVAGVVTLVADKDRVLSLDAVGFANLAGEEAMRTDTLFWIASQTKPITATALMMLVEEGKLNLDDPVAHYLPEFADQWQIQEKTDDRMILCRPVTPLTVRHILSHTGGLPFRSPVEQPTLDGLPLATAVRSYATVPLNAAPGTEYQYSNAGINIAGYLIERLSGLPFWTYLHERLLGPLGMDDTTFWPNEMQVLRLATSYRPLESTGELDETVISQLTYPLTDRHRHPLPAGGLFSTAEDVGRFCRMILNGGMLEGRRYLSEASVAEMTRKQTGSLETSYGLGWSVSADGSFGHGGAFSTQMRIFPDRNRVLVFLVQHTSFPPERAGAYAEFMSAALDHDS